MKRKSPRAGDNIRIIQRATSSLLLTGKIMSSSSLRRRRKHVARAGLATRLKEQFFPLEEAESDLMRMAEMKG